MTLKSYIILSRHSKTSITNMFFSSKLAQRHLQPLICQNALNIIIFVKTFITRCFSLSKHVQYLSSFKSKRPLPYYLFKTHTHTHKTLKGPSSSTPKFISQNKHSFSIRPYPQQQLEIDRLRSTKSLTGKVWGDYVFLKLVLPLAALSSSTSSVLLTTTILLNECQYQNRQD